MFRGMSSRAKFGLAVLALVATVGATAVYNARSTKGDPVDELSDGVNATPASPTAADATS